MCLGYKCPATTMLRADASELVCRRMPCVGAQSAGKGERNRSNRVVLIQGY